MTDPASFESMISVEETHDARLLYIEGMKQNYPDVDPRFGLLGFDNEGNANNVGFGYVLVSTDYLKKPVNPFRILIIFIASFIASWALSHFIF